MADEWQLWAVFAPQSKDEVLPANHLWQNQTDWDHRQADEQEQWISSLHYAQPFLVSKHLHSRHQFLPSKSMHKHSLRSHAVSVRPFVAIVYSVEMNKHIFKILFTILVFPCQMLWQYSDGNPPNGGVQCKEGMKKSRFLTKRKRCKIEP